MSQVESHSPTQVVAERLKTYRNARGWSARELAERCADAGAPQLERSIISNLENGRRKIATIDEVLILAWVLGVPPVMLFIPLGSADELRITPKVTVHPSLAYSWVVGQEHPPAGDGMVADHVDMAFFGQVAQPIRLYSRVAEAQDAINRADRQGDGERRDEALRRLAEVLDDMVSIGVRPPAVWHTRYDQMVDAGYLRNPEAIERWVEDRET